MEQEVGEILESRHILEADMQKVIYRAESSGEKLYNKEKNVFLAKRRIGGFTFYVEYSLTDDEKTYQIHTAYGHSAKIKKQKKQKN